MTMVHHAGLCPADIEASLRFYRDGVGLAVLTDFTMAADLEALLGRPTKRVRAVFLGSPSSPQGGTLELIDLGEPGFPGEPPGSGTPHRGVFLLSFLVEVSEVLGRLAELELGGPPRTIKARDGSITAATVVDPDGVTVELLSGPVSQLPHG
jgi:catechol 2,3-dioxygenase-like lactoylglutathione lyase family enzyme